MADSEHPYQHGTGLSAGMAWSWLVPFDSRGPLEKPLVWFCLTALWSMDLTSKPGISKLPAKSSTFFFSSGTLGSESSALHHRIVAVANSLHVKVRYLAVSAHW